MALALPLEAALMSAEGHRAGTLEVLGAGLAACRKTSMALHEADHHE